MPTITLRKFRPEDYPLVHEFEGPVTERALAILEAWVSKEWPIVQAIENDSGETVGVIELSENGSIGYKIHSDHRRQGYATAAVRAVIEQAKNLGFEKVWAMCSVTNLGSQAVLKRTMNPAGTKPRGCINVFYYELDL